MHGQRSLLGEYKMVIHVTNSGRASCYVLHLPSTTSSYGNTLLSKFELFLTDEELLEGDWASMLERAAQATILGV